MAATPRTFVRMRRSLSAVVAAALVIGVSGVSSAAEPTINACIDKSTKVARISIEFHSQADCKPGEAFKQWNITGPQGPTGAAGAERRDGCHGRHGRERGTRPNGSDRRRRSDGRDGIDRPCWTNRWLGRDRLDRSNRSNRSDGCHGRHGCNGCTWPDWSDGCLRRHGRHGQQWCDRIDRRQRRHRPDRSHRINWRRGGHR